MDIRYTVADGGFMAAGSNELGYVSGWAETLSELMHEINLQISCLYEEKAEEFNSIQEATGSFTRFQTPVGNFIREDTEEALW